MGRDFGSMVVYIPVAFYLISELTEGPRKVMYSHLLGNFYSLCNWVPKIPVLNLRILPFLVAKLITECLTIETSAYAVCKSERCSCGCAIIDICAILSNYLQ